MVQIAGKYQLESDENFDSFAKTISKIEITDVFLQSKPIIEIQQNNDQWCFKVEGKDFVIINTFKFGEPYEDNIPPLGIITKSTATREGNVIRVESPVSKDLTMIRHFEFTDEAFCVNFTTNKNDIKAKRIYKRL